MTAISAPGARTRIGWRLPFIGALYLLNLPFAATPASIALTFPVMALAVAGLARIGSRHVQVGDMFWFCVFVFFVLGPIQAMDRWSLRPRPGWAEIGYAPDTFLMASLIVFVFLLPFAFIRMEWRNRDFAGKIPAPKLLMILNLAATFLFVLGQGGLSNTIAPRLEQAGTETFIGNMLFLGIQTVTAALLALDFAHKRTRRAALLLAFAILLLALTRNPFNASRFSLLAAWVPLLLALFGGRMPAALFYPASLFGLTVLFPLLSTTTRWGTEGLSALPQIDIAAHLLSIPFVDVYDTLVHAVHMMAFRDWTVFEKLAAIVLFFIPRALWPDKPLVGGLDIGQALHAGGAAGTPNLSFFIAGDFYMDLGLPGVAIGGVLCALLLGWALTRRMGVFRGVPVLHFLLIASLPILLRGPVGAVIPLFAMQVFALLVIHALSPRLRP